MDDNQDADLCPVSPLSSKLTDAFNQVMQTRQIRFADWYELMVAPMDKCFGEYEADLITRLIYGVRRGIVKVVD
jgi:hypothetical protein